MNVAYLLTGGNMGDRFATLKKAKEAIAQHCGAITNASAIYETEAWGLTDQSPFLNQALELQTALSAAELLRCLLNVEHTLGRKRHIKYGPRIIDIDILLFNDDVIDMADLKIPHPELQNRRFALQCLYEIAPDKRHPLLHQTVHELLTACTDPLKVRPF